MVSVSPLKKRRNCKNMLDDGKLTSNVWENFQAIKGERVKGVIQVDADTEGRDWLIVFESGYSLQIHSLTGAFWINSKEKTKRRITKERIEREDLIKNLQIVSELLEA